MTWQKEPRAESADSEKERENIKMKVDVRAENPKEVREKGRMGTRKSRKTCSNQPQILFCVLIPQLRKEKYLGDKNEILGR